MKTEYEVPAIIKAIYDLYISPSEKKRLTDKQMNASGRHVRIQCFIPKEAYAVLRWLGAFKGSESEFFSDQSCSYIEQRAIKLEIMPAVLEYMKGAR